MCVYNDAVFTKACLEGIEPCVDQIVIVEGSWDGPKGTYDYGRNVSSDDGTRRVVDQFAALHPTKVVVADSIGDEECSRNLGLHLCEYEWILHLDSDEFYWPKHLKELRESGLESLERDYDRLKFPEYAFYFNFKHYMLSSKIRMFNASRGISYFSANGVGDNLFGGIEKETLVPEVQFCHFQWIGNRHKVLCTRNIDREKKFQRSQGEDPEKVVPIGGWQWWLKEIYLKFDGTNLQELEAKNRGSIHPWSFLHPDQRNHKMKRVTERKEFPLHVRRAPWFDFQHKGLSELEPDLA
jgi:hypothetical protein